MIAVGYNYAIALVGKHLYVTDSNVGGKAEGTVSRKIAYRPSAGVQLLSFSRTRYLGIAVDNSRMAQLCLLCNTQCSQACV